MQIINTEWGKDSLTQTQEDLSPQNKILLNKMSEFHTTTMQHIINLEEANKEILTLQRNILKLNEEIAKKNDAIHEILATRSNSKRVYYLGLLTGFAGIIGGIFTNVIYIIIGVGIAFTALAGIYEARKNKW